ncbi:MAG: hypothetical protein ACFWUM_06235 [Eubacteriales bacterium]|jgi:hypothetical protein
MIEAFEEVKKYKAFLEGGIIFNRSLMQKASRSKCSCCERN